MNDVVIRITDLSKYYKLYPSQKDRVKEALHPFGRIYHNKHYALRNINLEVQRSETLAIVGVNGSGKSTLLKLIAGVLKPNAGKVSIAGRVSALLELGAGFNPDFTGLQNIYFYSTIMGLSNDDINSRVDKIIEFADIGEFIHQPLRTYSNGMRSRLGFAVAINIDPDILILDEILAVGDIFFRRKCFAKMEELFADGKTIIYVSHDANSVSQLCSRAILLDSAGILMDSDSKTVVTYYQKLVFADENNKDKVRAEIHAHNPDQTPLSREKTTNSHLTETNFNQTYIADFVPKTKMEYDNSKVEIVDIKITDLDNRTVNVLTKNATYFLKYRVIFKDEFENVSFGMQIKTETGQVLTACSGHLEGRLINHVGPGDEYEVSWQFQCMIHNSVFYTNCGVSIHDSDGYRILNRIVDSYAFRVSNDAASTISAGLIPMYKSLEVRKAHGE